MTTSFLLNVLSYSLLSYTISIVISISHIATSYDSILNRKLLANLFDRDFQLKIVQVS